MGYYVRGKDTDIKFAAAHPFQMSLTMKIGILLGFVFGGLNFANAATMVHHEAAQQQSTSHSRVKSIGGVKLNTKSAGVTPVKSAATAAKNSNPSKAQSKSDPLMDMVNKQGSGAKPTAPRQQPDPSDPFSHIAPAAENAPLAPLGESPKGDPFGHLPGAAGKDPAVPLGGASNDTFFQKK